MKALNKKNVFCFSYKKILQRPDAALLAQQLNQALQDEARQREAFREWIDDNVKAAFINWNSTF
ncbi:MAG: hypothetical protein H6557_36300 [Lewinellaceae bacterium]|nr:hypothetical protein [Phaeodactylibacter sp.]MCB9042110.1 hypothetical protein [Lewinellaceae bacterium]